MMDSKIHERVTSVIADITATPIEEVQLDTRLDDIYLDSLDLAEIWTELESVYDMKISDPPKEPVTVQDVIRYMEQCIENTE